MKYRIKQSKNRTFRKSKSKIVGIKNYVNGFNKYQRKQNLDMKWAEKTFGNNNDTNNFYSNFTKKRIGKNEDAQLEVL